MQRQQTYEGLMDKFLQMPEQFREAFRQKEWFRAKYIYDSAIVIGLFLEVPEGIREQVMRECVIKNRLGYECVVYRIPGEVGFYGARKEPGSSCMPAGANPAYYAGFAERRSPE